MSAGSRAGTLSRAARTIVAVRSSGRRSFSEPLNARPIGERAAATMTASGMEGPLRRGGSGHPRTYSRVATECSARRDALGGLLDRLLRLLGREDLRWSTAQQRGPGAEVTG